MEKKNYFNLRTFKLQDKQSCILLCKKIITKVFRFQLSPSIQSKTRTNRTNEFKERSAYAPVPLVHLLERLASFPQALMLSSIQSGAGTKRTNKLESGALAN